MLRRRPLLRAAATTAVVAGTATAVHHGISRRQDRRDMERAQSEAYEQQQYYAQQAPSPPPPPAPAPAHMSAVEQLTQLAALHDQGALTDDEFAAEKAKILGS